MSLYQAELDDARAQGLAAHDAIDAWLNRPFDAPDVPGAILEAHARDLRQSRERIRALVAEHGVRDDLESALAENESYHRAVGLSLRGEPEPDAEG